MEKVFNSNSVYPLQSLDVLYVERLFTKKHINWRLQALPEEAGQLTTIKELWPCRVKGQGVWMIRRKPVI